MDFFSDLLGLDAEKLAPYQMAFRAIVLFLTSLILLRISGIRTLGRQSAFDTLTSLMLGSIMGRAVVAEQSFFGSILASFLLMLLHRLTAWITFQSKKTGSLIKGEGLLLMKNGHWKKKNLLKSHITEEDIMEALRHDVNITSLDKIKKVYLERSGEISIIKK